MKILRTPVQRMCFDQPMEYRLSDYRAYSNEQMAAVLRDLDERGWEIVNVDSIPTSHMNDGNYRVVMRRPIEISRG